MGRAKGLDLELFHEQVANEGANGGIHGSTMDLFIILTLEEEISVLRQNSRGVTICLCRHVGPLLEEWVLLEFLFNNIEGRVHRNRGERALTSQEVMTSPGSSFTSLMCCTRC